MNKDILKRWRERDREEFGGEENSYSCAPTCLEIDENDVSWLEEIGGYDNEL